MWEVSSDPVWSHLEEVQGAFPPSFSIINPVDIVFCRLFPHHLMDTVYNHHLGRTAITEKTGRGPTACCWNLQSCDIFSTSYVSLSFFFSYPLFPTLFPLFLSTSSLQFLMAAESTKAVIITQTQHKKTPTLHVYLLFCCDVCLQRPGEILRFHGVIL